MLLAGVPSEALAVLREARSQYPSEPSLELLLGTAEERYARQSEQDIVKSVLQSSDEHQRQGNLAGAVDEVARGLRRLPASRELLQAAATLREIVQAAEREKQMEKFIREVGAAMTAGDWVRALAGIEAGKREFPEQIVFDDLASQMQAKQHEMETEKALAGLREYLRSGDLERAAVALAELAPVYGGEELWKTEKRNLERLQTYAADLRKAEELRKAGRYGEAETILQRLVASDPPNGQAAALLKVNNLDRMSAPNAKRVVWAAGTLPTAPMPACTNAAAGRGSGYDRPILVDPADPDRPSLVHAAAGYEPACGIRAAPGRRATENSDQGDVSGLPGNPSTLSSLLRSLRTAGHLKAHPSPHFRQLRIDGTSNGFPVRVLSDAHSTANAGIHNSRMCAGTLCCRDRIRRLTFVIRMDEGRQNIESRFKSRRRPAAVNKPRILEASCCCLTNNPVESPGGNKFDAAEDVRESVQENMNAFQLLPGQIPYLGLRPLRLGPSKHYRICLLNSGQE